MATAPLEVAVIGAGVAGLTTGRALKGEGHQIVIYEKADRLGGTWLYDPRIDSDPLSLDPNREIVHGSLYNSLRTNLPRALMSFSDYPFPGDDPMTFPGHDEVLQFLNDFAGEFGLTELIRFRTEVVRVESRNGDEWVIESRRGEMKLDEVFDAVVVCNGHHTCPRLANFPGMEKWPGKQMHSHNYRVPEPFEDQIVVVIGDGASAYDIAKEISLVAKQVHRSTRTRALDDKVPKLDIQDCKWQHHSEIDYVDGNGQVVFQDGACVQADIILHCTGYKYDFPFLKTNGIVAIDDNRVGPLYKHVFPPKLAPKLSFVGITYRSPIFLAIDLQAKWVAHVLSGKASLPSEETMLSEVEKHYQTMEKKGIPKHHTHCLYHETYLQTIIVRLEEWRIKPRDIEEWIKHRQLPKDPQPNVLLLEESMKNLSFMPCLKIYVVTFNNVVDKMMGRSW